MSNFRAPHLTQIDGYSLSLSAGANLNDVIAYNGTSFIASSSNAFSAAITDTITGIGTAQTPGFTLVNTDAATSGAQKYSPGLVLQGDGYGTVAGTSQAVSWLMQVRPVQGTVPTDQLVFFSKVAAGSYTERMMISDAGLLQLNAGTGGSIDCGTGATVKTDTVLPSGVATLTVKGRVNDGASAVGVIVDNVATLSTAGAQIVNFKTGGTTKSNIDINGGYNTIGAGTTTITGIGTTIGTPGLTLVNTDAATSGNQKFSPALVLQGDAYGTTAGTSQACALSMVVRPVQSTTPTFDVVFSRNINAGGQQEFFKFTSGGLIGCALSSTSISMGGNAVTISGTTLTANSVGITDTGTKNTAGASILLLQDSGATTGVLYNGMYSGVSHVFCYAEALTASGTVTAGDIVVWAGSDGNTVATAGTTNNLTTIAGVAVTGGTNVVIKVARSGRCVVSADAAITVGQLVGTSSGTAGHAQSGTPPGAGAILGRACSATSSSTIIVDIVLG